MALGDLYQVRVGGEFAGQDWECVFYYEQRLTFVNTDPTTAQIVAERFQVQVLPSLRSLMNAEVLIDRIQAKNLFNDADAFTQIVGETGDGGLGNSYLATFNAYGFELAGDTEATRRGAKRVPGVIEEVINDGVVTDVGFIANMQDFADACTLWLSVGTVIFTDTFAPVIVKRVRSGSPGAYLYRLPENVLEKVTNTIIDVLIDLVITSQVSRKIGVGA